MSRNDNYPDDIRQYDNDPRSPFYVDPDDEWLEDAQNNLCAAWEKELAQCGYVEALDWDMADFEVARGKTALDVFVQMKSADYVNEHRDDFRPFGEEWD
jgi:hypothetical protein